MFDLSHNEARELFAPMVDETLEANDQVRLRAHLDHCDQCRAGWGRYEQTVRSLRGMGRDKAPPGLANVIVRRSRKQKSFSKRLHLLHQQHRMPVEVLVPILLAAVVGLLLLLL